jgi:hypothetical protein
MSGFDPKFVGLLVGFVDPPDKSCAPEFIDLRAICRVCRVFSRVERSGRSSVDLRCSNATPGVPRRP